eukprot:Gb_10234 [translate_table: standard]
MPKTCNMKPILIFSSLSIILGVWLLLLLFSNLLHQSAFVLPPKCSFHNSSTPINSNYSNSSFSTAANVKYLLHHFLRFISGFRRQKSGNGFHDPESKLPWPIFVYPPEYGVEKYLLRRAMAITNRSCDIYTQSSAADVIQKIEEGRIVAKSSLKYLEEIRMHKRSNSSSIPTTFGGKIGLNERKQYFHYSDSLELPCGFVKYGHSTGFLVSEEDQAAMESCRGLVIISAIFGGYDRLRQPRNVRRITAENACLFMFVDNGTLSRLAEYQIMPNKTDRKIGLWRIVLVSELPYRESVMNGLIPKYLPHRLFPNSLYSIWMDAKLQLVVDPFLILEKLLISQNVDIALSKHPYNVHTMEEAIFTVRWKKWSKESIRYQMEQYCGDGLQPWSSEKLPYTSDVPDTALIIRKHSLPTNLFSCLLFNELQVFNPRDQLAFAYVRDMMNPKVGIHMFEANVFNTITNEFRHSHKVNGSMFNEPLQQLISFGYDQTTACKSYLERMWKKS